MYSNRPFTTTVLRGTLHEKHVILADVNIPYKFSIDRAKNKLFFCINADEFSEQSFHSVVLDLDTGSATIIPNIRNGFASAVDCSTSTPYLGGSNGIFKFNYNTGDIHKPALVNGIDIFDMHFKNDLYFVDTANQNLFVYKHHKISIVPEVKDYQIQHFLFNGSGDLYFVSSGALYQLPKREKFATLYDDSGLNFRGAATDARGIIHFMAEDGIYTADAQNKQLVKIINIDNGYGLAFDKDNNIIYGDERSVVKLIPVYEK